MRKPNPLATVGAPISLMSNAAPKVAIMVASRCCVYILHSFMYKIMYSTHSTCHFSSSAAQNVATLSIYTYSICSKTNKHSGVKNIFLLLMKMSSSTVYALKKIRLSSTSQPTVYLRLCLWSCCVTFFGPTARDLVYWYGSLLPGRDKDLLKRRRGILCIDADPFSLGEIRIYLRDRPSYASVFAGYEEARVACIKYNKMRTRRTSKVLPTTVDGMIISIPNGTRQPNTSTSRTAICGDINSN
jgi:hypothetical protein